MRALIVDDEELARNNLAGMLDGAVEIIGEAASGAEAIEKILELAPDAMFLDVEMPDINGFDVLAQLSKPPLVVFVTAYDHYAIHAFETHAVDNGAQSDYGAAGQKGNTPGFNAALPVPLSNPAERAATRTTSLSMAWMSIITRLSV